MMLQQVAGRALWCGCSFIPMLFPSLLFLSLLVLALALWCVFPLSFLCSFNPYFFLSLFFRFHILSSIYSHEPPWDDRLGWLGIFTSSLTHATAGFDGGGWCYGGGGAAPKPMIFLPLLFSQPFSAAYYVICSLDWTTVRWPPWLTG